MSLSMLQRDHRIALPSRRRMSWSESPRATDEYIINLSRQQQLGSGGKEEVGRFVSVLALPFTLVTLGSL